MKRVFQTDAGEIWGHFPLPFGPASGQREWVKLEQRSRRTAWGLAWFWSLSLAVLLAFPGRAWAAETAPKPKASAPSTAQLPGVAAAQAVSQVTGIAISPALGVAAVGAWKYFHTASPQRATLPWWAQPWFWGPALVVVLLVFAKDAAGPVMPKVLKKPVDALELFENKFSAILATGAVIPLVWSISQTLGTTDGGGAYAGAGLAAINYGPVLGILTVPLALVAYLAVFLVSHVIHVLIVMSPFGTVDAFLKSVRLFLISTVAATSLANPVFGALWSGLIILACLPLAAWAFRWMTFGHVFAWDLVTFHRHRRLPTVTDNRAFLVERISRAPRRSYGWLSRNENGRLQFHYRPWLVFAVRTIDLPEGRYALGRGLIQPELLRWQGTTPEGEFLEVLDFPPRYAGHEKLLGQAYGITEIRDVGIRAMWAWVRSQVTGKARGSAPTEAANSLSA